MARIREMTIADHPAVMDLLRATPGVSLRDADSREATARYLGRNPSLSFVAEEGAESGGHLVGCVMCGHDGRRGYLQHLAVAPSHRRQGIGRALVAACLDSLESLGIRKTHIDVLVSNREALRFWIREGWRKRDDIVRLSFVREGGENV